MSKQQELPTEPEQSSTVVEVPAEVAVVGKKKSDKTGNLILDVAHEVEQYSKSKAINEADRLAENIEVNYFKLGGVLKLIADNSWYEGFATLDEFVYEKYGFQGRKARYLMQIYTDLVSKQIPWDKVAHLGWTKLKDLSPVLTLDNVDEWVAKAEACTVAQLQALLKAEIPEGGETTQNTTDEIVKMSFKLKPDQADVVSQAVAKAKGELHTEYDTVALENVCAAYVGGLTSVVKPPTFAEQAAAMGWEAALGIIAELFPHIDINVAKAEVSEVAKEAPAAE